MDYDLLNQVSRIVKNHNKILDATGARFNVFGLCGVDHYENTHSNIIAEFLNPKGSHSLGTALLGVLDVDSPRRARFGPVDQTGLETLVAVIVEAVAF